MNDDCVSSNSVGCTAEFSALSDSTAMVIPSSTGYTFRVQFFLNSASGQVQLNLRSIL